MVRQSPARAALVLGALYCSGLAAGAAAGTAAVARAQDPYGDLDRFARILGVIEAEYVEPVPTATLIDGAIDGMVGRLDEHSRWLSASEATALRDDTAGERTGLGIDVAVDDGGAQIVRVLPGSPASRDGLRPGDRIVAVDGAPIAGMDPAAIEDRFAGARGETAVLSVVRAGSDAPTEIRTVRDTLEVPAVEGALLGGGIAWVRLVQFQAGAGRDLQAELSRLEGRAGGHLSGILLDLRDDPGGLLTEAVAVADLFLDAGPIVSTRRRAELAAADGTDREHFEATPSRRDAAGKPIGGWPETPLAVLVNGGSASAAEIVAAALQDTHRAKLVGQQTYGKGSVQQVFRHTDGSALKLTVGLYYTASGEPVAAHHGRIPDVPVDAPRGEDPAAELRDALGRADLPADERARMLDLLARLPADPPAPKPIPWDEPPETRLAGDPVVQAALKSLR